MHTGCRLYFYAKCILLSFMCHPINNVKEILSMGSGIEVRELSSMAIMKPEYVSLAKPKDV